MRTILPYASNATSKETRIPLGIKVVPPISPSPSYIEFATEHFHDILLFCGKAKANIEKKGLGLPQKAIAMTKTKSTAVAGTFYPSEAKSLRRQVNRLLDSAASQMLAPRIIVAPHAGYQYSGPIAASVYKAIANQKIPPNRVLLLGPSHYAAFEGIAYPTHDALETPLGKIRIDQELRTLVSKVDGAIPFDQAHSQEHSLETQLPLLQSVLPSFTALPIAVSRCPEQTIASLLQALWKTPELLIVISSDLSHFLSYEDAYETDLATIRKIESGDFEFGQSRACGHTSLKGLMIAAKSNGAQLKLIDYRNSGDTAGSPRRVVGYGAFVCDHQKRINHYLSRNDQYALLQTARASIEAYLHDQTFEPDRNLSSISTPTFVTLRAKNDSLRGCMGSYFTQDSLPRDIASNAVKAATRDDRFKSVSKYELPKIVISISLLYGFEEVPCESKADLITNLVPKQDGLFIQDDEFRSLFLPHVWGTLSDGKTFVDQLFKKARLSPDHWSQNLTATRFRCVSFSETDF